MHAAAAERLMHEQWASGLDPRALEAAECTVDFDAEEATCPACGEAFAPSEPRCPGCGLRFG